MSTYRCYVPKKFTEDRFQVINKANRLIERYEQQGLSVTLRQLYYRMIALDLIPDSWVSPEWNRSHGLAPNSKNNLRTYRMLGDLLSDARMAGLVSWTSMEDRVRNLKGLNFYDSPAQALARLRKGYRLDKWHNQPWRPEVWVEKEAMEGVLAQICNKLQVDFFATKGYNSQSEQWRAAQRMVGRISNGQRPIIFHLGDHDPSGVHMTQDIQERLALFAGTPITVVRIALTMAQVRQYNPPPNPAKESDSRFASYQERFGDESWELDALDPMVVQSVIEEAILKIRDEDLWAEAVAEEEEDLRLLDSFIEETGGSPTQGEETDDDGDL